MVKSSDIIYQCYINLTDGLEKYQDNWMSDETWFRVISSRYPDVINSIGFSHTTFIRAISMHASQCGTQNALGIFIHQFKTSCLYDSGQRRRVSYFYRQVAGNLHQLLLDHVIAKICMLRLCQLVSQQRRNVR